MQLVNQAVVIGFVCIVLVYNCQSHLLSCNLPPSLWCSSLEVARACKVEEQCDAHIWSQSGNADLVQFTLYLESLCPDCQDFVREQLFPTYKKLSTIIDLRLVPYGNAMEHQEGNRWVFECQHGEAECLGNIIETCAMHFNNDSKIWFPFVACIEMSDSYPAQSAPKCAKQFGIDYATILQCTKSDLGNQLEHQMAVETDNLNPPHDAVPWVTLNGVHTDDIQQRAESDLSKLICDTYKGPHKPDACKTHRSLRCSRN